MNNDRCFCGHLAQSHSPFREITIKRGSAWKQVELTSCTWCDKALINLEVKRILRNTPFISGSKTERKAVPPHPFGEDEPRWMRVEKLRESLEFLEESLGTDDPFMKHMRAFLDFYEISE